MTIASPNISCDRGLIRDGNRLLFRTKGGRIVYESREQVYSFDLELAVPGFLVYFPRRIAELPTKEREAVFDVLLAWLSEVGYMPKPEIPVEYAEEDETCLISGCTLRRLKGRYICHTHFQLADLPESGMVHFVPALRCV